MAIQPPNSSGFNTYPVNIGVATPQTVEIFDPSDTARFAVYQLFLENYGANYTIFTFYSGSTAISGPFTSYPSGYPAGDTRMVWKYYWSSDRIPLLVGRLPGEAFNIGKTLTGVLTGWALCAEFTDG